MVCMACFISYYSSLSHMVKFPNTLKTHFSITDTFSYSVSILTFISLEMCAIINTEPKLRLAPLKRLRTEAPASWLDERESRVRASTHAASNNIDHGGGRTARHEWSHHG